MNEYRERFREVEGDTYWSLPRIAAGILLTMLIIYGLGFLATGGDLAVYKFWAPKQENARREVFENTQSYVQGKTEYLSKLRFQYQEAEPASAHKASLRMLILSEASTVDPSKLPSDLQIFVSSLRSAR